MAKNGRAGGAVRTAADGRNQDLGTQLVKGELRKGIDVLAIYPVDMSAVPEMGGLPPATTASAPAEPGRNGAPSGTAEA